jgi:hypothetical protein
MTIQIEEMEAWLEEMKVWSKEMLANAGLLKINLLSTKKTTLHYVRFEVFMAVTMKNAVFWDVTPCGSCKIA